MEKELFWNYLDIMWLVFVLSTIVFGFFLINSLKKNTNTLIFQLSMSWLIGSMVSGTIIMISSYFLVISFFHGILLLLIQISISLVLWRSEKRKIPFKVWIRNIIIIEKFPGFFFVLTISAALVLYISVRIFKEFPNVLPKKYIDTLYLENSFIQSVINGSNRRRKNFFFNDPHIDGENYPYSPIPLLYTAVLMELGMNYESASAIIGTLNTVSTVTGIYILAFQHVISPWKCVFLYFFHNPWGWILSFFNRGNQKDLFNDIGRTTKTIIFPLIPFHLIVWKESSFSIPLSLILLSMIRLKYNDKTKGIILTSCLFFALIPNFLTSISVFLMFSFFPESYSAFMYNGLILLMKMLKYRIKYNPIWRNYQMHGYFYSPFLILFDSFGFMIFDTIIVTFFHKKIQGMIPKLISSFGALMLISVFRQDNDFISTSCSLFSTVLPIFIVVHHLILTEICEINEESTKKGVFIGIEISVYLVFLLGSLLTYKRIIADNIVVFNQYDYAGLDQISKHHGYVLNFDDSINPSSFLLGKVLYYSNVQSLKNRGIVSKEKLIDLNRILKERICLPKMKDFVYYENPFNQVINMSYCNCSKIVTNSKWNIYYCP